MAATTIFKNTLFLYLRSFLTLVITLYTSRLVLLALGIEDWGIYSVVGGFVSMFGFLNASMSLSIQRYLSYEMTKNDGNVHHIFCQGMNIILFITLLLFLIIEICGSYYVLKILNVPENKRYLSFWVFQLSALSLIFTTLRVPYSALTVARERLDIFAYMDIANSVLKLIFVLYLVYLPYRLLLYSSYFSLVVIVLFVTNKIICNKLFPESRNYVFNVDWIKSKEILGFTGWTTLSSVGMILRDQAINLMFNNFLGLTVNAAYGIARQVSSSIQGFVSNVVVAFSPPIYKSYAAGDKEQTNRLLIVSSKLCSVLILLMFIPLYFEMDYILQLWLKNVPDYTSTICKYVVFVAALIFIAGNNAIVIRATGNVRQYELSVNVFNIIFLLVSYVLLVYGFSINYVFISLILITIIQLLYMLYLTSEILQTKSMNFIYEVICKLVISVLPSVIISNILCSMVDCFFRLLSIIVCSSISLIVCAYFLYLNNDEKKYVKQIIYSIKNKFICKK